MAGKLQQSAYGSEKSNGKVTASERAPPAQGKKAKYASYGVKDNDVFKLPAFDWQVLATLTIIGAVVRLFRIYQPSSVVFDEVQ